MRILLVAAAFIAMGAGASFAQGLPAGTTPQVYGADAFPNPRYHNHTALSEWLRGSRTDETKSGNARPLVPGTKRTADSNRL